MDKKKLYLMIGPAGGGKTTWIQDHASAGVSAHISRDRIRFDMVKEDEYYFSREDEVYEAFVKQIAQALASPWVNEVFADATHLTRKGRERLISEIDELHIAWDYEIIAVIVKPELEVCLAQNALREGRAKVPETVIRNMYNTYQSPLKDDLYYRFIYENDKVIKGEVE
jgi:predicted kinase